MAIEDGDLYLLKLLIFHSYVSFPEGISQIIPVHFPKHQQITITRTSPLWKSPWATWKATPRATKDEWNFRCFLKVWGEWNSREDKKTWHSILKKLGGSGKWKWTSLFFSQWKTRIEHENVYRWKRGKCQESCKTFSFRTQVCREGHMGQASRSRVFCRRVREAKAPKIEKTSRCCGIMWYPGPSFQNLGDLGVTKSLLRSSKGH